MRKIQKKCLMNGVAIAVAGTAISAIAGCVVAGSEKGKKWDNYGLKQIFSEKNYFLSHFDSSEE